MRLSWGRVSNPPSTLNSDRRRSCGDLVTGALGAGLPGIRLRIAHDLLLGGVPGELAAPQPDRDVGEVAGGQRPMVGPDVGDGHGAVAGAFEEVGHVAVHSLALAQLDQERFGDGIAVERIDGTAGEVDPVSSDEDS